ncbi:hypothetical protein GCM10010226_43940 [Streptomyces phaeofaciens]|uniref:Uncharacterized protein n=1 Tax=Streptomyces phaeofaciens TaxID=68254 RepID=A0A918HH62_9ACTN|nr:hypothetical protein GCM10010226_43940 [Streptomyces phaeofaciens]
MSGVRGSDWVLPERSGATTGATSALGAGRAVAAVAGGVRGRARAAAHVTPIEEVSNPRMPTILDIAIHICPLGS